MNIAKTNGDSELFSSGISSEMSLHPDNNHYTLYKITPFSNTVFFRF